MWGGRVQTDSQRGSVLPQRSDGSLHQEGSIWRAR